jgi:hypothetical protein
MAYWISDGVSQNGPYPIDELPQRGLQHDSLVWKEGMAEWKRAGDVQELALLLSVEDKSDRGEYDVAPDPIPAPAPAPVQPAWQSQATQSPIAYQSASYGQSYGYAGPLPQGMAIASMVLGIVSLVTLGAYCFGLVPAILAVIFGHISIGRNKAGIEGGRGMATAGLICGYISIGLAVLGLIVIGLFVLGAATM